MIILHVFGLRIQDEDISFFEKFFDRHQELRARVWMARHHMVISRSQAISLTRVFLSDRSAAEKTKFSLITACTSVLLTLVIPEECPSREEAVALLKEPQALWAVLVVNSPSTFTQEGDATQHMTPIAQYIRGVANCLSVQHSHAGSIFTSLKVQLEQNDDNVLFDDERITNSRLYHRVIKTCHLLNNSITSSIRFIERFRGTQTQRLWREAHEYEADGITHWCRQLESEVDALEDMAQQITSLRETVQEDRNTLHGATAVLQARLALQQGNRMKTLTYLATAYLPLATVASIYSMSVLPSSATFPSVFVVFAVFLIVTVLSGIWLSNIREKEAAALHGKPTSTRIRFGTMLKPLSLLPKYLLDY